MFWQPFGPGFQMTVELKPCCMTRNEGPALLNVTEDGE